MAFGDGTHVAAKRAEVKIETVKPVAVEKVAEVELLDIPPFDECPYAELVDKWGRPDYTDEFILDIQIDMFEKALKRRALKDGRVPLSVTSEHKDKVKSLGAKWDAAGGFWWVRPFPGMKLDRRLRFFCW